MREISNDRRLADAGRQTPAPQICGWRHGHDLYEAHAGEPLDLHGHLHQDFQIAISTRAPGRYLCEGRTIECDPGNIIVFNPGEMHGAASCARHGGQPSQLVYIAPGRAASMLSETCDRPVQGHLFASHTTADGRLTSLLRTLHELSRTGPQDLESDSASLQFFILLWRELGSSESAGVLPRIDARDGVIRIALSYIHERYNENILLETLAAECGISPFHLCRTFTKAVGVPPHAYQTSVRIDAARKMLAAGERGAVVAAATGFFDQSHFTRKFKRCVGVSPAQYAAAVRH